MADLMQWRKNQATELMKTLRGSIDKLPMGERINGAIDMAENAVIDRLKDRLELAVSSRGANSLAVSASPAAQAGSLMSDLIRQANSQTKEDAQQHLYALLLKQLVPDEIRIISALSDGGTHAMIHVAGGPPIGPIIKRVLNNYSYIGRSASIRLEDMTPQYLEHLIRLGLAESGPEDKSLEVKYEVMSHDKTVRAIGKKIEKEFRFPPRILRRTIRATELGRHLWHDCLPAGMSVQPVI